MEDYVEFQASKKSHVRANKETQTDPVFFLSQAQLQEIEELHSVSAKNVKITQETVMSIIKNFSAIFKTTTTTSESNTNASKHDVQAAPQPCSALPPPQTYSPQPDENLK